jgi:uncharacterized protein YwqG
VGWLDRFLGRAIEPEAPIEPERPPERPPADALELLELARSDAPLERQREALGQMLAARGVSAAGVEAVLARARDGITLLEEGDGASPSRLGGEALLPAGAEWPVDPDGRPMTFIGVFDLGELPHLDPLPERGKLVVYWDHEFHELDHMDFHAATRVFYAEDGKLGGAEERAPTTAFGPVPLTGVRMPIVGEWELTNPPAEDDEHLDEAVDALEHVYRHQLLGSSRDIQAPVLHEIPYWFEQGFPATRELFSEPERRGEGWTLLAQIEETGGLGFGDAGALYLVIPDADLRARRFDRVLGIMQCH